jgi:hypothetical protein
MPAHDPSYKLLFSHRALVADLLRGFVREDWVGALDLGTLERPRESGVSPDLREREDDLIWRVRCGEQWLYVYLLLEFQSTVDPLMAARLLTYIGLLWQDLAAAGAIPAGGPLPPVLSIVLYNGAGPWHAATDLDSLLPPALPRELRAWQPQLRYLLLDEQAPQDAALAESANLAAALFRLESSRTPADIQAVVGRLIEWLAAPAHDSLRRAFVVWLKRVLLPARAPGVELPPVNDLQEMHAMLAERVKTWTEDWKQQGIQEGLEQGIPRGEAKLLRRQLLRRFGPLPAWVEARLDGAGEPELEAWGERLLDSTSLEDVFAAPNGLDPED